MIKKMATIKIDEAKLELLFSLIEDGIQYRYEHQQEYESSQEFYNKLRHEVA